MKTLKLSGGMKVVDLSKAEAWAKDSHAGQHSDKNGPFEVWWSGPGAEAIDDGQGGKLEPGWYWWSCHPGCLPDGEANGPFMTSREAYEDAKAGDA